MLDVCQITQLGSKKKRNQAELLTPCWICLFLLCHKNWRLQDCNEEDRLLLLLGGEGFTIQRSHFSPSYVLCCPLMSWSLFLWTMEVNISVKLRCQTIWSRAVVRRRPLSLRRILLDTDWPTKLDWGSFLLLQLQCLRRVNGLFTEVHFCLPPTLFNLVVETRLSVLHVLHEAYRNGATSNRVWSDKQNTPVSPVVLNWNEFLLKRNIN